MGIAHLPTVPVIMVFVLFLFWLSTDDSITNWLLESKQMAILRIDTNEFSTQVRT